MSIKQAFKNPISLVAQGFIAGAILFWATNAPEGDVAPAQSASVEAKAEKSTL